MTHHMNLKPHPFRMIANGYKTIELRLLDEKRSQIAIGDTIVFANTADPNEQLLCQVKQLHPFTSFAELYQALPLDRCGYLPEEISTAAPEDMLLYYSAEKQRQYGVVGIEIALIQHEI